MSDCYSKIRNSLRILITNYCEILFHEICLLCLQRRGMISFKLIGTLPFKWNLIGKRTILGLWKMKFYFFVILVFSHINIILKFVWMWPETWGEIMSFLALNWLPEKFRLHWTYPFSTANRQWTIFKHSPLKLGLILIVWANCLLLRFSWGETALQRNFTRPSQLRIFVKGQKIGHGCFFFKAIQNHKKCLNAN